MPKMTSVVKIINNSQSILPLPTVLPATTTNINKPPAINIYESSPSPVPQKQTATEDLARKSIKASSLIDDMNNNHLRLGNEPNNTQLSVNNINSSTLTTVSQIARIHSNGTYLGANGVMASSNYSMSTSLVSTSTIPAHNTSNLSQNQNVTNNSSTNSNNTISTSSIAIIDVNKSLNQNNQIVTTNQPVQLNRNTNPKPSPTLNDSSNSTFKKPNVSHEHEEGVKYKFISNQTIGDKTNAEFDDIIVDNGANKKLKCLKCCSVMWVKWAKWVVWLMANKSNNYLKYFIIFSSSLFQCSII